MRIGHLPAGFFPNIGGAQISTHNIAEKQKQLGHDVFLVSRATDDWKVFKELKQDVNYHLLPLLPKTLYIISRGENLGLKASALAGWQAQYYQRKYDFEVWHLNLLGPIVVHTIPYLKKTGTPLVGTCRGMDIQKFPEANYGWRLTDPSWEKRLVQSLNQLDLVTAISDSVKEEYLSLGVPEEKIRSIPNGVNYDYIRNYKIDKEGIRNEVGWPLDKNIILTVGRNHPKKGYKYIPEIIKSLLNHRNDFLWVIVGSNSEPIKEMADKGGIGKYLKVMSQIGLKRGDHDQKYQFPSGDLVALYKAADVFAFPTLIETFGNVNMESMAAGIPVVVTDAPGCRDIVFHEKNGLVSKVGDVKTMANHIHSVLQNEQLRNRLIKTGYQYAESISWPKIAQRYLDAYQEAILLKKQSMKVSI